MERNFCIKFLSILSVFLLISGILLFVDAGEDVFLSSFNYQTNSQAGIKSLISSFSTENNENLNENKAEENDLSENTRKILFRNIPGEEQFEQEIRNIIDQLPLNEESGKKDAFLFVTNSGYEKLTRNAMCSALGARVKKERIVVLALDDISYASMESFGVHVLLYPTASKLLHLNENINKNGMIKNEDLYVGPVSAIDDSQSFHKITKAKLHTISLFIHNNADVTISDSDVIFPQNPFLVLSFDTELECTIDSPTDATIPSRDPYFLSLHIGFAHISSSKNMKDIIDDWTFRVFNSEVSAQSALQSIIKGMTIRPLGEDSMIVESSSVGIDEKPKNTIKIKYINPLYGIQAIGPLIGEKQNFIKAARVLNLSAPYWCHFNGLGDASAKESLMRSYKLWYLNSKGECSTTLPSGNSFPWWH